MTDQVVRVRFVQLGSNGTAPGRCVWMRCPGCDDSHTVTVDAPNSWTWDGNEAAPTISPSIKVMYGDRADEKNGRVCHSFVRAGRWEFLADCTHALAGQTVPMVPLPDWLNDDYVGGPA